MSKNSQETARSILKIGIITLVLMSFSSLFVRYIIFPASKTPSFTSSSPEKTPE